MSRCDGNCLAGVHLFQGLSPQELDAIAHRGTTRTLRANTLFIHEGEESSQLYLILSGEVKVYRSDARGREEALSRLGPGEHLGELALLGDSVRTASAMTLENTRFLVLSRRAFLESLGEHPQIALNLDDTRLVRTMTSVLGSTAAERYQAWSSFRRSGLPLVLLIGGCTGTGKSTVAAELSLRLDIGRTQSTDILREVMRLFVSQQTAPELHASTFAVRRTRQEGTRPVAGTGSPLIDGFRAQADVLAVAIDGVIERSVKERASTIIEGIHVHPAYHERVKRRDALVVPILLTTPSENELKRHFARRGQQAPARGAVSYLENFASIWSLQNHFVEEAKRLQVPVIPNIALGRTVRQVMQVITDTLMIHASTPSPD